MMLIAILPSHSIVTMALGFLLFRYFDAKKPWLVGLADRKIKGALGVMVDDIVAALFALISYYIIVVIFLLTMGAAGLALFGYGLHD
jgi:phosphatidylglycerophosphatase A